METASVKFVLAFTDLAKMANDHARAKGFYEKPNTFGDGIALCHSELSEALEGFRHGNPPSEHIPEFTAVEEEFADVILRIMDMSYERGERVAAAVCEKMKFNAGRPYKHGGKLL